MLMIDKQMKQKKEKLRIQKREWERNNRVKYTCPKSRTPKAETLKINKGTFLITF